MKKLTKAQYIQKLLEKCENQYTKITLANRKRGPIFDAIIDLHYAAYCIETDQKKW